MTAPVLNIKATDKVTHSRRIAIGSLLEVFKSHCGAPEQATVLWPGSGMVPPFDAREVEIIWTDDEATENRQPKNDDNSEEIAQIPVATGEVQVGDLVKVQDFEQYGWSPDVKLIRKIDLTVSHSFTDYNGANWRFARHLTDEERAQIKRI